MLDRVCWQAAVGLGGHTGSCESCDWIQPHCLGLLRLTISTLILSECVPSLVISALSPLNFLWLQLLRTGAGPGSVCLGTQEGNVPPESLSLSAPKECMRQESEAVSPAGWCRCHDLKVP